MPLTRHRFIFIDRFWLVPTILALAIGVAYINTLSVPFLFDDLESIEQNSTIKSAWSALSPPVASGITVSGRPILNASFAISNFLGGGSLAGHHVVNILIHYANALLLFSLIWRTLLRCSSHMQESRARLISLSASLLWAIHPLQTESVTYLVQRAESLAAFFYLITLWLFLKASNTGQLLSRILLIGSTISCALGMGTKEVMASAPLIIFLYDRTFVSGTMAKAFLKRKYYYISLLFTWSILILSISQSGFRGNTTGFEAGATWISYLYTQAFAITHYLRLVIWPAPLVFDYGRDLIDSFGAVWWRAMAILAGVVFILKQWIQHKPSGFLGIFSLAMLAPTSLIPVATQTIAEHRIYLASVPLFFVFTQYFFNLIGEKKSFYLCLVLTTILSGATIMRNRDYRSVESIWNDTRVKHPKNDRAWYSLGHVYLEKKQIEKAKENFIQAIKLHSDPINIMGYAHALVESGDSEAAIYHYRKALGALPRNYHEVYEGMANLGMLLGQKGQYQEAIRWLNDAIELNPVKTGAYYNLGVIYFSLHQYDDASRYLRIAIGDRLQGTQAAALLVRTLLASGKPKEALTLATKINAENPGLLELRLAYAQALAGAGHLGEAISEYQAVLIEDPAFPSAHTQLGILYFATRRLGEARSQLVLAVSQNTDDASAQSTLAEVLLKFGEADEAVSHFEAALHTVPNDRKTRYLLANTLLQLGEFDRAISHYERLIQENAPQLAEIHNQLAVAYAQKGDFANARIHFSECLRLNPKNTGAAENLGRLR